MTSEKIDTVVVTFNRVRYFIQCAASLLVTIRGRVIVVDNASTDPTRAAVNAVAHPWPSIRNEQNQGCARGRNQGFEVAAESSDFVAFTDDDMYFFPGWQEAALSAFAADPKLALVSVYNDQRKGLLEPWEVRPGLVLRYRQTLAHGACMVRAEAFKAVGGYPDNGKVMGFFGTQLCQKLTQAGWKICQVDVGRKLVEHMDLPESPFCLRDYYDGTGYNAFRADAKKNKVDIGNDVSHYFDQKERG